jgi:hypothetical protein
VARPVDSWRDRATGTPVERPHIGFGGAHGAHGGSDGRGAAPCRTAACRTGQEGRTVAPCRTGQEVGGIAPCRTGQEVGVGGEKPRSKLGGARPDYRRPNLTRPDFTC